MLKKIIISNLIIFSLSNTYAQKTAVYSDINLAHKRGLEYYEQGLYGQAQVEFTQVLEQTKHVVEPQFAALKASAELHKAKPLGSTSRFLRQ